VQMAEILLGQLQPAHAQLAAQNLSTIVKQEDKRVHNH
jgi:hypothetical protein